MANFEIKKNILILISLIFITCSPKTITTIHIEYADIFGEINNEIPQYDSLVITLSGIDTLSYGKYALLKNSKLSSLKTGIWKEFHSKGVKKSEGEYKIGHYVDCCTGGACMSYYHYKIGEWKYYDSLGNQKFKLKYYPDTLHVNTRCQGGDYAPFGLIKNFSKLEYLYDLKPDDIFQLQKVEIISKDSRRKTIITPISGELVFNYELNNSHKIH
ncbi:hypothetical protein FUAX_32820 [Fulvitalea axinellae]|uniref:Lipoprotein n=1 Tax=Fulvitalea axinellae TaxID=1182444 RepID=A0AAU9CN76_9BACT|nr:hypothetical protein FUAX_32820 [Fulvitalea axinellae]